MFHLPNQSVSAHALARVNFPLFVVKTLTERHVLVAGGGGESNTGIANSIEIYELFKCPKSNTCRAKRVAHFDTGTFAIMNATVFQKSDHFILATGGRFGLCVFYRIKFKIENETDLLDTIEENQENRPPNNQVNGLIRRRTSSGISQENGNLFKERYNSKPNDDPDQINLTFEITRVTEFQADFNPIDPYVKEVKYSSNAKLIVTGGTDGFIRLFGYPDLRLITTLPAHDDEIKSFALDPTGLRLVSTSRDQRAFVWNLKEFSKLKELKLNLNNTLNGKLIKYDFRDCSFGIAPDNPKQTVLFTVHNPVVRTKPPSKSIICRWNTRSFEVDKIVYAGIAPFSKVTISDDGRYIGIGLLETGVEIYDATSLSRIYYVADSHKIFVTGVQFLNSSIESKMLVGDQEASLISVSIDKQIVVHHLPKLDDEIGFLGSSFLFVFTLFLIYLFFGVLGL